MPILIKPEEKEHMRFPRLDTVLMVERCIQEFDGEYRKKELWENLPKKMMYQTYCVIIDYLLYSKKISIDSVGKIGWIYYPKNIDDRIKNKHLFWKKD
jgi:hypothetical protein